MSNPVVQRVYRAACNTHCRLVIEPQGDPGLVEAVAILAPSSTSHGRTVLDELALVGVTLEPVPEGTCILGVASDHDAAALVGGLLVVVRDGAVAMVRRRAARSAA